MLRSLSQIIAGKTNISKEVESALSHKAGRVVNINGTSWIKVCSFDRYYNPPQETINDLMNLLVIIEECRQAIPGKPTDIDKPPDSFQTTISRIIRDTAKTKAIKALYENKCQICGLTISIRPGVDYSEVHHIRPLGGGHSGADNHGNMIVLCPTHHAMFDFAIPKFISPSKISIYGTTHQLTVHISHEINKDNIDYHNSLFRNREDS
jgi:predicted restriction endonuclease